jgi:hypothetical protein
MMKEEHVMSKTNEMLSSTALPEAFNPEEQEGSNYDVLPKGEYVAQVIEVSVSPPKSGDGYGICLTWQIIEGEYENRYAWQRITFQHSKPLAQHIGRQQLKDLCVATGVSEQVTDVEVFKFIPCRIRLGIERDKDGVYPDKNKVARVLPLAPEEPQPPRPAAPKPVTPSPRTEPVKAAKAPEAAEGNSATPPWREPPKTVQQDIDDSVPY